MEGLPAKTGLDLVKQAASSGLVEELVRQLNKDLAMSGQTGSLAEGLAPGAIVNHLKDILDHLIRDDFQGFLNLLYRADVDQSKMTRSEGIGFAEYLEQCTYELLRREWQKVWIRNKIQ